MQLLQKVKAWARRLKLEIATLYLVCRHPGTPWHVKLLGLFVVAYALSPVDLIPDFIPIVGFLDEAVLLPALIWLSVRLTPGAVLSECRAMAHARDAERAKLPKSYAGAVVVVMVWAAAAYGAWRYLMA